MAAGSFITAFKKEMVVTNGCAGKADVVVQHNVAMRAPAPSMPPSYCRRQHRVLQSSLVRLRHPSDQEEGKRARLGADRSCKS